MSGSAFPSKVTQVDLGTDASPQRFPLGYEVTLPATKQSGGSVTANAGPQTWVYVFNDDPSVAFAAGKIIYKDPSAATHDFGGGTVAPVTVHQPKVMCLGVAQHAIAVGSYGFILKRGVGTILAGSGGLTADTPFTSGGAGTAGTALDYADDASTLSANIGVIGHSATAIAADATGTAYINCG
jgi:hypothetical protein